MTAREYLSSLERFGVKLGLENIRTLLTGAGDPHEGHVYVHVGGTNGKGGTLAFLDAILTEAGLRTARYTSPHLIALRERFLIGREPISDPELDRQIGRFRDLAAAMDPPPTFFELTTAVALGAFAEAGVDLALMEVGLGGRFDATNIIMPKCCAITTIDLDHQAFLGSTLEAIAFEKAGILKPGVPCVLGPIEEAPAKVIRERASSAGAPLVVLGEDFDFSLAGPSLAPRFTYSAADFDAGPVQLGIAGRHQAANAALAVALARILAPDWPQIDRPAIERGLALAVWPCRLEKVLNTPPVYIDVAHNPAGARALARHMPRSIVLAGFSEDKDVAGMLDALAPLALEFLFCPYQGRRSCPAERLAAAAGPYPHRLFPALPQALAFGLGQASYDAPLLITGSVFLAGEARQWLCDNRDAAPLRF